MAAFLAEAGYDSSEQALEAPRGFAHVLSDKQDFDAILNDLGSRWEASLNSYKHFACGIVIHPTIDGFPQIRAELGARVKHHPEGKERKSGGEGKSVVVRV